MYMSVFVSKFCMSYKYSMYVYKQIITRVRIAIIFFTFMGPRIVNVFNHNQQDATLHSGTYYYKCCTCFRWFLRPSSGAQNCIHSIGYFSSFYCFLLLSVESGLQSAHNRCTTRPLIDSDNTRCCRNTILAS
jgi:hypothetical protein